MTNSGKVYLTRHDRKDRLGHGGLKEVAAEVGVHQSLVSRVLNGKKRHGRIEAAIARRIVQSPDEVAFPPREEKKGAATEAA